MRAGRPPIKAFAPVPKHPRITDIDDLDDVLSVLEERVAEIRGAPKMSGSELEI
jgi:hypothetical protein